MDKRTPRKKVMDSYVRLAIAKYVKERKELYHDVFEDMKGNSNRKVRSLASP